MDCAPKHRADPPRATHRLDERDLGVGAEAAGGAVDVVEAPAHECLGLLDVTIVDDGQLRRRADRLKADRLHEPPDIPCGGDVDEDGGVKPWPELPCGS